MKEQIISEITRQMLPYLDNAQLEHLLETLQHCLWEVEVIEKPEGAVQRNTETNETTRFEADEEDGLIGIFSFIGYLPQSKIFESKVEMESGYIKTDEKMATSVPGVYAAGDVRVKNVRQVVTASGDGATAAVAVEKYLRH